MQGVDRTCLTPVCYFSALFLLPFFFFFTSDFSERAWLKLDSEKCTQLEWL